MDSLMELGVSLKSMVSSYAWSFLKLEILKRTVLATLWSALWPVYLLKMAASIDNPFSKARNRSEKAGQVLADALINKAQGERPVTLIGYSLGPRVIYSCLKSLAEREAFGLVEFVVFIGAPVPSTRQIGV
jgi:thioesterase domain-containing protein